jgi:hypothetical protein
LFVDWKGAFDNVDHLILMKIIKKHIDNDYMTSINIKQKVLRIVEVILKNSSASVDNKIFFDIEKGVP